MYVTWYVVKFFKGMNFGSRNYDRIQPNLPFAWAPGVPRVNNIPQHLIVAIAEAESAPEVLLLQDEPEDLLLKDEPLPS